MNAIEHGTAMRIAITVVVVALSVWVITHHPAPAMRYVMVDELVTDGFERGRPLEVHGYILPGSIAGDDRGRTFVLTKGGHRLRVFIVGPVPDVFRDQAEVVVAGELVPSEERLDDAARLHVALDGSPVLAGKTLLMKCAIRYDGGDRSRQANRFE